MGPLQAKTLKKGMRPQQTIICNKTLFSISVNIRATLMVRPTQTKVKANTPC